jgi:hypothetical protein
MDHTTEDYIVPLQLQELRRGPVLQSNYRALRKSAGTTGTTAELQPLRPKSGFADDSTRNSLNVRVIL